jgi:hypothetical protein
MMKWFYDADMSFCLFLGAFDLLLDVEKCKAGEVQKYPLEKQPDATSHAEVDPVRAVPENNKPMSMGAGMSHMTPRNQAATPAYVSSWSPGNSKYQILVLANCDRSSSENTNMGRVLL